MNKVDRKAFARCAACWWPGGHYDLGKRIKEANPKAFAEFYKRVLSDKTGVEVLAVNELPLGSRGGQSPKVMWEIWCSDPGRRDPESGRGTPVAVLYVRFREDYSQAHEARHSSIRCIHATFCCIQEDRIPEDLANTGGVENCANLWVKVVEMEDNINKFHTIEVQEMGWRWRVPWETTSHCARLVSGAESGCWTINESMTPLKTVGGVCQGCDHVCEECLAFAAVRKLLEDALETPSGVTPMDGSPDLRAPVVSKVNTLVEGLCLPIDLQEHAALASYENYALLLSFLHGPGAAKKNGVTLFCEHLEALHWSTQLIENVTTLTARRAIQAMPRRPNSANLFLFVGNVIRVREATYMLPDDVHILASFRHNRVDWEEEVKTKAFSLDWFQEQVAAMRAYGAPPVLIIVESHETIGDLSGHYIPTCQRRAHNSMVLRCYRNGGRQLSEHETQAGSAFLARLQHWIIQRAIDFHDTLMRLNSGFESEFSECELKLDYDGLRQNFMFHPSFQVIDGSSANRRFVPLPSYEVEPEDRMSVVQSFRSRLVWGVPPDAVAGKPGLVNRKVRIPSLGVGAQDSLTYLESRCLECKPEGSWMRGVCMLHGDHGTGKTTIAGALVHRLYWQNCCHAFFWLHGTNSTQLYNGCLTLAKYLGLVDDDEDALEAVLARLRQWMKLHPGWFLVLEDVEDEAVMDLLDLPLSHGMVLVISRPAHWKSVPWQNLVEMPHLSNDEGQAYALRSLRNEQPSIVDSLLRELHNHPLSLSLALCLMNQEKLKLVKFMATKKPVDMTFEMRYCAAGMTTKERGYMCALMSVLASTMTALHKIDPELQFMMLSCACCHSEDIHRNIFQNIDNCDRHFDTLICYGCLDVSGDATLKMNPLLQLAIREHFPDLKEAGLDRFCALLEKGMSYHDKERMLIRAERSEWLVHVLEAESLGGTFSFSFVRACAEYIAGNLHDLDEPLRLFRKLHEEASTHDGDYPRMLAVAIHTGELHLRREEYHDAQFQLEQFLKMFADLECQRDGLFVKATCLVGDCLRAQGKHAEALNRYEQALYACSQFPVVEGDEPKGEWFDFFLRLQLEQGEVSDFEAMSRQFVLDLSRAAGLPNDSIRLVRIALNTMQSPFQELTPGCTMVEMQVLSDIHSLLPEDSKLYRDPMHFVQKLHEMCQIEDAEKNPLSQGRMTSLISRVSCTHLEGAADQVKLCRADILSRIGDALTDLDSHELAESKYQEALHVQTGVLQNAAKKKVRKVQQTSAAGDQQGVKDGAENQEREGFRILAGARNEDLTRVATTLLKIGRSRTHQRKFEKAIEAIDECRAARSHVFGHEHRAIAEVHELYGSVLHEQARYRQAVQVFDRAKRIYRTRLGPESWAVARAAVGVGMAQDELGQLDSAAAEYSAALKIYETCKDTLNAARCMNNLAVLHRKQGNYAKAQAFLAKAKTFISNKIGEKNMEFAGIVRNMGSVHFELEAWEEAQRDFELSLKIVRSCTNESIDAARNMLNLGSVHLKMSRYRNAYEMFGQAYAILIKWSGPQHVDTARALVGLGTSNEKLGDLVQARSRLETALPVLRQALGDSHLEVCGAEMNLSTVLLKEATAKTKPQDDGAFPMSSAFCLELKMKKDVLEDLRDNVKFQKLVELEMSQVLGVQPAQIKMTTVLPERNAVVMRVYRGAAGATTPADLVKILIEESHDAASKLYQGTYGSKVKNVEGFDEPSDSLHMALSMYKHVVQIRTDKIGGDDLDVANALRCIGSIYMLSRDRNQAVAEYWKATRIFESRLGKDHDDTLSTHRCIEAALEEELLLATKTRDAKTLALKEAAMALAATRSKAREAIKLSCEDAEQEAIAYFESVSRRLEECRRWLVPNPFSYTPVRQRLKRTTRFKIKGNDLGPECRGKFGTVQEAVHDDSHIFFKLDNGVEMQVSGIDFENNADYVMPDGLEVGRKLVITGLAKNTKYNGLHGRIKGVHRTDPHRCYVVSDIENLELEVKFENCEFALHPNYRQGLRVKLQNLTANNSQYNGTEATIVRAFEQDPSRILVRVDNGNRMFAIKSEHMELVLPKGYSVGCRVMTEGLKKKSQNGRFGTIERPDEEDIDRAIVWIEPVGEVAAGSFKSIRYENLRFALPRGLEKGRQVVYNSVKGRVVEADRLDSTLIVVNFPGCTLAHTCKRVPAHAACKRVPAHRRQ